MSAGDSWGYGLLALAQLAEVNVLGRLSRKFAAWPAAIVGCGGFTMTLLQVLTSVANQPALQPVNDSTGWSS